MLLKNIFVPLQPEIKQNSKVMKKAIIFTRVSTSAQHLEEQEQVATQMAVNDGYTMDNLYFVSYKESGIKKTEEERAGIAEMKSLIESDPEINAVYVFEISRIARTKKVLFSISDYLLKRGIQLSVKEPNIKLLNPDGTINEGAELVFTLFGQLAESEMRVKKERFKNGKALAKSKGQFVGGRLRYGYRLDKRKVFLINEHEAEVVQEIFDMMVSGEHSLNSIAKEMVERGEFANIQLAFKKVQNILHGEAYCGGEVESAKGYNYVYPAIIDADTYRQAQEMLSRNQLKPKRVYKHVFLGRGIIKDCEGYTLCGKKRQGSNYYAHSTHSGSGLTIASTPMDNALWIIAKSQYKNKVEVGKMVDQDNTQKAIEELKQKITVAEARVNEIQDSIDRIEERIIKGRISAEKGDRLEDELVKQRNLEEKNIVKFNDQLRQLEAPVEASGKWSENIDTITDRELQHSIIREVIEDILLVKESKNNYRMEVHYKPFWIGSEGLTQTFHISTRLKNQTLEDEDGTLRIEL